MAAVVQAVQRKSQPEEVFLAVRSRRHRLPGRQVRVRLAQATTELQLADTMLELACHFVAAGAIPFRQIVKRACPAEMLDGLRIAVAPGANRGRHHRGGDDDDDGEECTQEDQVPRRPLKSVYSRKHKTPYLRSNSFSCGNRVR
jgi:hypothetical protein